MTGVVPSYAQIRSVDLAAGRFVEHSGEVVLESAVAKDLLKSGPKDVVGKTLKIRGKSYEVVGVLEVVKPAFSPPVPESSYMNTDEALALSGAGNVGQIVAEAKSAGSVDRAETPTSSHPQAKIKVRSTRIKIRSRCVPLASQRGAEVLTSARMLMSHQKFAMVQEAARASHLGAGEPPVSSPTGRPR